eukprot:2452373-Prymnesium_polylepis.1
MRVVCVRPRPKISFGPPTRKYRQRHRGCTLVTRLSVTSVWPGVSGRAALCRFSARERRAATADASLTPDLCPAPRPYVVYVQRKGFE